MKLKATKPSDEVENGEITSAPPHTSSSQSRGTIYLKKESMGGSVVSNNNGRIVSDKLRTNTTKLPSGGALKSPKCETEKKGKDKQKNEQVGVANGIHKEKPANNFVALSKRTDFSSFVSAIIYFKAKFIGEEPILQAKNEQLVNKAFSVLQKLTKKHKPRVIVMLSVREGIRIISDTKKDKLISTKNLKAAAAEKTILECAVHKVTYYVIDKNCSKSFGLVVSTSALKYQFYALKVDKNASDVIKAIDSLFDVTSKINKSQNGSVPVQSGTLQLMAERAIDVPIENVNRLKADINYENKLKIPQEFSLSDLNSTDNANFSTNSSPSPVAETSTRSTKNSIGAESAADLATHPNSRQSGRFREAFSKFFSSKRRGTSMIDVNCSPDNVPALQYNSRQKEKSRSRTGSDSSVKRKKGLSRSTMDVSAMNTNKTQERESAKKGARKSSRFKTKNVEHNPNVDSFTDHNFDCLKPTVVITNATSASHENTTNDPFSTTGFEQDPFGFESPFGDAPATDWASFDNKNTNVQFNDSNIFSSQTSKNHEHESFSLLDAFDPFSDPKSVDITINGSEHDTIGNHQEGPLSPTSLDFFTDPNSCTMKPISNVDSQSFNNNHKDNAAISPSFLSQQKCAESPGAGAGFGQDDLSSAFAFTSEAREVKNYMSEINSNANKNQSDFDNGASEKSINKANSGCKKDNKMTGSNSKKIWSKSAFDLLQPDLDDQLKPYFSDGSSDISTPDENNAMGSNFEWKPSTYNVPSVAERGFFCSVVNIGISECHDESEASFDHSGKFFMKPTNSIIASLSGAGRNSISNFSSSAINGSQSRIDKPALKKISKIEQPFNDPFFS